MKIKPALVFVTFLVLPTATWSEDAAIKINYAPLLFKLGDPYVVDAVRAAFSLAPFQSVSEPSADVLTLATPDGAGEAHHLITFTVLFLRNGRKLGEAVESCPVKKLSECTDELVLDTEAAAK